MKEGRGYGRWGAKNEKKKNEKKEKNERKKKKKKEEAKNKEKEKKKEGTLIFADAWQATKWELQHTDEQTQGGRLVYTKHSTCPYPPCQNVAFSKTGEN